MPDVSQDMGPTNAAASLLYNEYIGTSTKFRIRTSISTNARIAYDVAQVRLRYLLRVNMAGG